MLLGSAMRIGELLSLDRDQIDFVNREARIIGKGNKERTVFFTARALDWLTKYLQMRTDSHPALFVRQDGKFRLKQTDVWRPFARIRRLSKEVFDELYTGKLEAKRFAVASSNQNAEETGRTQQVRPTNGGNVIKVGTLTCT